MTATAHSLLAFIFLTLSTVTLSAQTSPTMAAAESSIAEQRPAFVENRGQWSPEVTFLVQTPGLNMWVVPGGVVYDLHRVNRVEESVSKSSAEGVDRSKGSVASTREGHVIRMRFADAEPAERVVGLREKPGRSSYFIGDNPQRWATDVRRFASVQVEEVYTGIDAVYYIDQGRPRYDLVVAPGADPHRIRMEFEGSDRVRVAPDGSLRIGTSMGDLQQSGLYAYQQVGGENRQVSCSFVDDGTGEVRFRLGEYDSTLPLVIDPLVWSTYIGGALDDRGHEIALDSIGNVYVAGPTFSPEFPTTSGAYTMEKGGESGDIYVAKFDLSKSGEEQLIYATYLGGDEEDAIAGLAANDRGHVYLSGHTSSVNFPTTSGAYDRSVDSGGVAIYAVQLDLLAGGIAQLAYSTYLAGDGVDLNYGLAIDAIGGIYLTGRTSSSDFPTTAGALSAELRGDLDAYVTKLDPSKVGAAQLSYSTYLGGEGSENGFWLAVDQSGTVYVVGSTGGGSPGFPTTGGAYSNAPLGATDIFVSRLDPSRSGVAQLLYSTLFGGEGDDNVRGVAVDSNGVIYLGGFTNSPDLPTTEGAWDRELNGAWDLLVAAFDPSRQGVEQLRYSTYLGGSGEDRTNINDLVLDGPGTVYVTGYTDSEDFPTTPGAVDRELSGTLDGFVTKLDLTSGQSTQLPYSTLIGGSDDEWISGLALDQRGHLFITGQTWSTDYPTTEGAYSRESGGGIDAFAAELRIPTTSTISIDVPNGSESWCSGSNQEIRWNSSGVSNVKIELSTDGGTSWNTIISSVPAADGLYNWIVLPTPSTECRVRLTSVEESRVIAQSETDFSISTLRVTDNPRSQTLSVGDSIVMVAEAEGVPPPSVLWQRRANGGTEWEDIVGATFLTYGFIVSQSDSGDQYRAVFSNGACDLNTTAATVTVQSSTGVETTISDGSTVRARIVGNPVQSDMVTLEVWSTGGRSVSVRVVDLLGKPVLEEMTLPRGSSEKLRATLDVSTLPSGTYMVVVMEGKSSITMPMTLRPGRDR